MSGFVPVAFPQFQGRVGDRGLPGAPGATGPAGANGPAGALALFPKDLSQSELANMNTTPVIITPDNDGFNQLPLFAFIEINLTTAGAANPSFRVRWRGTSLDAVAPATIGLNGTTEIKYFVRWATAQTFNQIGVGLRTPIEGLGLQCDFSISPGGVFQATGRVTLAMATVPAVIS